MRNVLVALLVLIGSASFAQVSITVGPSMLSGFKRDVKPWGGFHVGIEVPRDDQVTIYGRFTHHFKQSVKDSLFANEGYVWINPKDPTSGLFSQSIGALPSMNYNILEGGTRYYLGNGFDFGWAAFGGSNIMIIFSKVKGNYQSFDESAYKIDENSRIDGSIFGIGVGLGGGVKYTFPRLGTMYFDLNLNYLLFGQPSSPTITGQLYSPLIFNFNIGYRRDLIW